MRWILSLLALLSVWMAIPTASHAQLRVIPVCELAPDDYVGQCFPMAYVNLHEFTVFANHIMRRIPKACSYGVLDPTKPGSRFNLVLLGCQPMSLLGPVELEP